MGEKPQLASGLSHKGEKVLLFLHGGGYVILSAHPDSSTSQIPRSIIAHCANASANVNRSFNLEYRLSTHDPKPRENPFPAALLDALAGYAYLIDEVGFEPADIIVVGDSAGGNLALALVRYLIEEDTKLAPPGALILLSPWADMGNSHKEKIRSESLYQPEFRLPNSPRALARGVEFMPTIPSWPLRALTASISLEIPLSSRQRRSTLRMMK